MATKTTVPYENNPFMIGIEGLKLIFGKAKGVGIYSIVTTCALALVAIVVYFIALLVELAQGSGDAAQAAQAPATVPGIAVVIVALIGVIFGLISLAVSLLLFGPLEYAAAMTAKGQHVTLGESFKAVLVRFPSYFWMYVIFTVKVFLWSLLFIVPGIIMFNRYLLAGTVFFAEGKRGNAAIRRSAELTKGAWLTTYGGAWIWNIISQGIAALVFWPGTMAVLYRQLKATTDAGEPKPKAHLLSWLTLLVPISLTILYILFMILIFALIAAAPTAP